MGSNNGTTPPQQDTGAIRGIREILDGLKSPEHQAVIAEHENRDNARRVELAKYRLGRDMGPRYSEQAASFAGYKMYHAAQKKALASVAEFVEKRLSRGLVLYGSVGTGKDHLMAAALYAALNSGVMSARWRTCQDLYGDVRDQMDRRDGGKESELLMELTAPQILALSDPTPPAGPLSPWRLEFLYRLVDRRYHAMKQTWVTINAKDIEDAEAKLSSQVWDRLQHDADVVPCFWPSFRERR